ncbi:MAG TPA: efflux transporter periplasmic adaptor subunit [Candidatus Marinimicrobia bacterium]|jgi:Cu(I)/Ag(I) efflux system membrane fusion protein|nr:efflux transporter periplasmic adaptor subunit [Acidiferrobacteraceae bacterium]HCI15446.1 efflux transporter periplasmic adaptor subunit [Candidatus Neomarinimicrobiota bacterium]|tara:strand:- start:4071 stop:6050 length:1980 start_codon:yes stop_codon:yes gene_type:complete
MENSMNIIKNNKTTVGLILIAFFLGLWISSGDSTANVNVNDESHSIESQVWTCSMHPNIHLPELGQCPICFMDLIPLESGNSGLEPNQLSMSESAMKLANIETIPAILGKAELEIHLSGKVEYDESRIGNITAWVPGRLERMFVDYTGISVNKGDHMMELYSPELYTAQEELIQARKLFESNTGQSALGKKTINATLQASREKLRLMGLLDDQIQKIESSDSPSNLTTVYSPMSGVVIQKNGVEGAYVKTGTNIYTIADLSRVWVIFDAYESDLPWLAFGQKVTFLAEAIPGQKFEGRIAFIDPVLDAKTRTVKVRMNVQNPDGLIKPGIFVHGTIHATLDGDGKAINPELANKWICPMHPEVVRDQKGDCDVCGMNLVKSESLGIVNISGQKQENLLIPASAVLKTGNRAIVYVKIPGVEPTFEGREVDLGSRVGDKYIVKSGLREGELVVIKGNFKIDSAMQIAAKPSMMNPVGGLSGTEHNSDGRMARIPTHTMPGSGKYKSTASFQKAQALITDAYFIAEKALTKDNFKESKTALFAINIVLSATIPKSFELSEKATEKWNQIRDQLISESTQAQDWKSIEEARKAFNGLSQSILMLEQSFGHETTESYYEIFCSMAFNNTGASWLSKEKVVNNPYFGASMLRCGEVKREYYGKK